MKLHVLIYLILILCQKFTIKSYGDVIIAELKTRLKNLAIMRKQFIRSTSKSKEMQMYDVYEYMMKKIFSTLVILQKYSCCRMILFNKFWRLFRIFYLVVNHA